MRSLFVMVITTALSWASATTYIELPLDQMLAKADIGFFGTVSAVRIEDRGEPWTVVTFAVKQPLLNVDNPAIELSFLGGALATGESLTVNLIPTFREGEDVLILAYDHPYISPIVGFRQGLWRLTPLGFRNEEGLLLSIAAAGALMLDGVGGQTEALLKMLKGLMANGP
jgi:hypothetical protein